MTKRKRIILILLIIVSCVGCDQITKVIAKAYLPRIHVLSFAGDTLRLDYVENKGAVLTFEQFLPKRWQGTIFTFAVAALLGLLILFLLFNSALKPLSVISLSLVWGGIFSNLLDRVALGGDVVDFLNMGWGGLRTGIFNVADGAITIGAWLFGIRMVWILLPRTSKKQVQQPEDLLRRGE